MEILAISSFMVIFFPVFLIDAILIIYLEI